MEPDETFIDYTYEEEEEGEDGAKIEHSVTTEHIDEADEEEVEESSSFIPDYEEDKEDNTVHEREIDHGLIVENLPHGVAANDSNGPKGPYVHAGRSRKSKSKGASASVVGTQGDPHEDAPHSFQVTVHTFSLLAHVCAVSVTLSIILLDPVR